MGIVKVSRALMRYPIPAWSDQRNLNRERVMMRVAEDLCPEMVSAAIAWEPALAPERIHDAVPFRSRGRPRQRWDD